MRLNKAKGRMYKKVTHTGTYCRGCVGHNCRYCFVKFLPWHVSQEPEFVGPEDQILKVKNAYIFLNSCGDIYSPGMPNDWISSQHRFISRQHPSNKVLEQTKNTPRFFDFIGELNVIKDRVVLGTTYETNLSSSYYSSYSSATVPDVRLRDMARLSRMGFDTMGSIEPVMDFDPTLFANMVVHAGPRYVEIGADNYRCGLPEPSSDKIGILIAILEKAGIEVIRKDGLERLYKKEKM